MSSKTKKSKATSTARSLLGHYLGKIMVLFFLLDIILVAALSGGFFFQICEQELGSISQGYSYEPLQDENNKLTGIQIHTKENDEKELRIFWDNVQSKGELCYQLVDRGIENNTVNITWMAQMCFYVLMVVLAAELIFLIWNALFGIYGIRRKLKPLDEMAQVASRLGNETELYGEGFHFSEAKVHDLEQAIGKITPNGPNGELHTSDADLQGLESAINGLLDRMRSSYQQQTRFVSDASHELRTPIAVIQGYVNMLDRWGKEDEKVLNESIEAIKHESDHMKKLVDQLLFLARGDSGRNPFKLEKADLSHIIHEVYEESLMIDENHVYRLDLPQEPVNITCDVSMLKQAVRILGENAAKYTKPGEIIKLGVGRDEENRPFCYVQDNGSGMDEKDINHMFERFYRADEARESKTGGTGLGLSIAKWIVDRHGGFFQVLSRKDMGTRITVVLPQKDVIIEDDIGDKK